MVTTTDPSQHLNHSCTLLQHAIQQSLNTCIPSNAAFLAERLHALNPTELSSNLLATCYFQQQEYARAAAAVEFSTAPENQYLYAVSCIYIDDDEHIQAAEATLRSATNSNPSSKHSSKIRSMPSAENTPGGAFGIYYLGLICERTGRKEEAAVLYRQALELNPTLWIAFESLAAMGKTAPGAAASLFAADDKVASALIRAQPFHPCLSCSTTTNNIKVNTKSNNATTTSTAATTPYLRSRSSVLNPQSTPHRWHSSASRTPPVASRRSSKPTPGLTPSHHPHHYQPLTKLAQSFSTPSPSVQLRNITTPAVAPAAPRAYRGDLARWRRSPQHTAGVEKTVRRSARLFASPATAADAGRDDAMVVVEEGVMKRGVRSLVSDWENVNGEINRGDEEHGGDERSTGQKDKNRSNVQPASLAKALVMEEKSSTTVSKRTRKRVTVNDGEDLLGVMDLLRTLAQAVAALAHYRSALALSIIASLPRAQKETGYVYSCVGRAYLEMADYKRAEEVFRKATIMDPTRLDGLVDHYSTVLWHLRKETQLSHLASRVMAVDRTSPAAWCVAGNCYALQHDPDTALQCFQKALLMDGRRPYTYTLEGHEHFNKEDFDSALASYRQALLIDSRHYNALYGMGVVFHRQEKYDLAERHFRAALRIHPRNSTLHYHLGLVQAAKVKTGKGQQDIGPALTSFNIAAKLDERNPIPRFQKAKLLQSAGHLREARVELINLRNALPKEAAVYFELGKVSELLEDNSLALEYYTLALDLDPQERRYKKAVETLEFAKV